MYNSDDAVEITEDRQELSVEDLEPCLIREYDEFPRFFARWIKFYPRKPYNTKRGYGQGFIQSKTKKGNPAALHGEWLVSCVERHLDNRYWAEQQLDEKRRGDAERFVAGGMDQRNARKKSWERYATDYEFLKDWPYWLALWSPKMTTDHCIDFDAKKFQLAIYRHKGLTEPVVCPDLEHFQTLKRIYDYFPGRVWCISSLTLGIHGWRRHRLHLTAKVHAQIKLRLEEIGLGSVEVHPMQGRCFRRPFGRDYLVITPETTLDDWRDQTNYYEDDARTAPFDRIVEAMLNRVNDSIQRYDCADRRVTKLRISVVEERLADILRWRDAGFQEKVSVPVCSSPQVAAEPTVPAGDDRVDWGKVDLGDRIIPCAERDGRWPLWVERMAITGLVADDTVGNVIHEMSKWLLWIELFDLPLVERAAKIEALLGNFVLTKHNGFITRVNLGNERNVLAQVRSAVRSASQIDRPESLELFERLRAFQNEGRYRRVINITPILDGCTHDGNATSSGLLPLTTCMFINKENQTPSEPEDRHETVVKENRGSPDFDSYLEVGDTSSVFSSLTTCMFINKETSPLPQVDDNIKTNNDHSAVSSFINKDATLPPRLESEIEQIARDHRMRKRNGEFPLLRFARRLLNTLWEQGGTARLNNEILIKMVGTSNPNQQVSYRILLQDSGLIEEGNGESDYLWLTWDLLEGSYPEMLKNNSPHRQRSNYQPGVFSKTYNLSCRAKEAYDSYYPLAPTTALSMNETNLAATDA